MRLLLILLLTLNLLQAKKIALLIGNSDYSFQPLSNPLHDVDGIYNTLKEIGFDISKKDVLKNASQSQMQKALANFSQRAKSAEIALVYFSGHGMQVNNRNYMFPARTTATKPVDLFGLVDLDYFIQSASSAKYGIILVDACRNNPLVKYFQNGKHKGSVAKKGLGQVTPTVGQVVIGFATSAGDTADDGNGRMSPYASALANRLKENDDVRNVLGKVAKDVTSKYKQNPIYRANLASSVYLTGKKYSTIIDENELIGLWKGFLRKNEPVEMLLREDYTISLNNSESGTWSLDSERSRIVIKKRRSSYYELKIISYKNKIMIVNGELGENISSLKLEKIY